jgi:hypothetical protein
LLKNATIKKQEVLTNEKSCLQNPTSGREKFQNLLKNLLIKKAGLPRRRWLLAMTARGVWNPISPHFSTSSLQ